jgi:hypothetical protein
MFQLINCAFVYSYMVFTITTFRAITISNTLLHSPKVGGLVEELR